MKILRIILVFSLGFGMVLVFNNQMIDKPVHKRNAPPAPPIYLHTHTLDTTIRIGRYRVQMLIPNGPIQGDVLLLPGWDFPTHYWSDSTTMCTSALHAGYRVIMPDMHRSVYATHYYPETRADMAAEPTRTWLTDTVIPLLKKQYGMFTTPTNFIAGISTGGRGVALVCSHTGHLFKAGAALSGDFDQTLQPNDALMIYTYGAYATHTQRWKTIDNPLALVDSMHTPLFIAHGADDNIVLVLQSKYYYEKLVKAQPASRLYIVPNRRHNFHLWKNAADSAWQYFMHAH